MKTNAVARIIIFSVIILVLFSCLIGGLSFGMFSFASGSFTTSETYTLGGGSVNADAIEKIEIDWAAGSITIQSADTDQIIFSETGSADSKDIMAYDTAGGTLSISFSKPSIHIGFTSASSKDLTVTVPNDWVCHKLSIDAASADTKIEDLIIEEMDIDSASNTFSLNNCSIGSLDIDGASNTFHLSGTLDRLNCDGMTVSIYAVLNNVPDRIEMDGMSGKLDLTLPPDCGFRVTMEGLSNAFSSDFQTVLSSGAYEYGNGACTIDVDGMSVSVNIRKGE